MTTQENKHIFISGKFAVIHSGHIRLFMFAKSIGGRLTVALDIEGIDSEEIEWRSNFLKNIKLIDEVVVFNSDLKSLILQIKPDYVIKGNEFASQFNVESEIVSSYGGELIFSSGSTYFSEKELFTSTATNPVSFLKNVPRDFLKRNDIDLKDLKNQILKFKNVKVCIIGDLIIDEYVNCFPIGMSREEPTLVVTPMTTQKFLGGAGIVAAHTSALGAETTLISIIGKDANGLWGVDEASTYGVKVRFVEDKTRPTNLKQRFRSGSHSLLKVSYLGQDKVDKAIQRQIVSEFEKIAPQTDLLVLSDFSYGVLSKETSADLIKIARENKLVITADSQTSSQNGDLSKFNRVDLITPTEIEARSELRDYTNGLAVIMENLRKEINPQTILIKLGEDGVVIGGTKSSGEPLVLDVLPSLNLNPVDVSGAGDSLLAAASLGIFVEANPSKAALIGSLAAAVQISRIGNQPVYVKQLLDAVE